MNKIAMEDKARIASRELVQRHYLELDAGVSGDRKVVYLFTSGLISELFRSFDFIVTYPEMNAIHSSRRNISVDLIHDGEELGYASHICDYVKCDLGLMVGPRKGQTPFGKIPPPDLIVITHGGCSTYIKWAVALAGEFRCPVRIVDVPFVREDRQTDFDHVYVRGQIEELIPVCEELSGRKFDLDKLKEILKFTSETIELWKKLQEYGKLKPSPFDTYFEGVTYMAPMTLWRGTLEARDYYKNAHDYILQRIKAGYTPYGKEDFRLLFEGAPPWPRIREFQEMFSHWHAVGVTNTYVRTVCAALDLQFGPDKPFDFLASLASQSYYNWNLGKRRGFMLDLAKDYEVDGIVIHSAKSCRPFSIGQLDMRNYFAREADIPTLYLDSDIADPRYFSSAQMQNRIDTFFEALTHRKERRSKGELKT